MVCSNLTSVRPSIINSGCALARWRKCTGCRIYWGFIFTIRTDLNWVPATPSRRPTKFANATAFWRGKCKRGLQRSCPDLTGKNSINCRSRKVVLQQSVREGFNPAKPDYSNTPASSLRPARSYQPTDPAARPVVTIITPFFNTGDIFDETAKTVLGQTFQQWEWLIVNDASTAPAAELACSVAIGKLIRASR